MKTATLLATVSAASNRTSGSYDLGDYRAYSIQALVSGADVAGTLKLQSCNDNTTWVDIAGSSTSVTSSADTIYNISEAHYQYVRADWVASSGTGNITVTILVKDLPNG